jgi:hypothetical protein
MLLFLWLTFEFSTLLWVALQQSISFLPHNQFIHFVSFFFYLLVLIYFSKTLFELIQSRNYSGLILMKVKFTLQISL